MPPGGIVLEPEGSFGRAILARPRIVYTSSAPRNHGPPATR
jgi:hypothetical protein